MPKLTIRQWPLPIETGRATILDAALDSGVPFPHGCRTGECGSCKCLLLSGDVSMKNYDREALNPSEKAAGFVLACRARPRSDVHVSWLGGTVSVDLPVRRLRAQVTNIEQVSPTIKRLYLWPEAPLQFAAGQFARLTFGELPPRAYSMASVPGEEALEFHVRLIPGGKVSEYIDGSLQVGDSVQIEGPFGNAHLRPDDDGPLVLVAGSSGLAPAKSIVRTALRSQPERRIHVYFGVRNESHVYDEGEMNLLVSRYRNLRVDTVLSEPEGETARRTGNLAEILRQDLEGHRSAQFYMAGPPEMVDAVSRTVADFGIRREQIHADPFHVSGTEPAAPEAAVGGNLNRLLGGMLGLLSVGRLRHPRAREPFSPAKAMEEAAASTGPGNDARPVAPANEARDADRARRMG